MARLIDADKLIDFIDVGHLRHSGELCYSETEVANLLLHAPTVDAVPVRHGRWVLTGADKRGRGGSWKCTGRDGCGKFYPYKCDFCPNCGAKMDGSVSE